MKPFFFLPFSVLLFANPQAPVVQHGEAQLKTSPSLLEIQVSDKAILNWESFSIGSQETTRFIQPSIDAAVLNRVTGLDISQIDGLLEANGHVYLLNPNGIIIGPNGRVDTAGFTASVLDIQNGEFLSGDQLKIEGLSSAQIVNLGTIETKGGKITLIAHKIDNQGDLLSQNGTVELFSGHELLFDPRGDSILFICPDLKGEGIENSGKIEAFKIEIEADVAPTSRAIGLGGMVEARAVENIGGEIYLTANAGDIAILPEANVFASQKVIAHAETGTLEHRGKIHSPKGEARLLGEEVYLIDAASIDVSGETGGGTVLIGGDYKGSNPEIPNAKHVYSSPDARVNLSATKVGNGGKAIFWADEGIAFYSKVKAEGGLEGGNGGFVEVSSPGAYFFGGLVSTLAPKGNVGVLLLDPTDITISAAATAGGSFSGGPPYTFSGAGPTATLNNTDLENQLALGNVIIDATAGAGGNGDITFDAPLTVSQNTLGVSADRDIIFNADFTLNGTGSVTGGTTYTPGFEAPRNLTMNGPLTITLSSSNVTLTNFNFVGLTGVLDASEADVSCTTDTELRFVGEFRVEFIDSSIQHTGNNLIDFITLPTLSLVPSISLANTAVFNTASSITFSTDTTMSGGSSSTVAIGTGSSITAGDQIAFTNIGGAQVLTLSSSSLNAQGQIVKNITGGLDIINMQISGDSISLFPSTFSLQNSTLTSNSALEFIPTAGMRIGGTVNLNAPDSITLSTTDMGSSVIIGDDMGDGPLVLYINPSLSQPCDVFFPVGALALFSADNDFTVINNQGSISFTSIRPPSAFSGLMVSVSMTASGNIEIQGDVDTSVGGFDLNAGGNFSLTGNNLTSATSFSVSAGGSVTIQGNIETSNGALSVSGSSVSLQAGNSLSASNGLTVNANAGAATLAGTVATTAGAMNLSGGSLSVPNGGSVTAANGLTVNTTGAATFGGTVATTAGAMNMSTGSLSVPNGGSVTAANGLTASASGDITIGGSVTASAGSLEMTAGNNFNVTNGVVIQGASIVNLLAGKNFIGTGTGTIQTNSAVNLNIVADNLFPNPPNFGNGYISFEGYTLQTNGASLDKTNKVYLYTSIPGINTFPSTINGEANPGGVNEFIGYWYVTLPPPDPPFFEIIYKSSGFVPVARIQTLEIAVTEPVANPSQIDQVTEGTLQPVSIPDPKVKCKTPSVSVQAL